MHRSGKDEHQKFFAAIKHVIGCELLLAYPNFNAPFEIHTDAYKLQIDALIFQKEIINDATNIRRIKAFFD